MKDQTDKVLIKSIMLLVGLEPGMLLRAHVWSCRSVQIIQLARLKYLFIYSQIILVEWPVVLNNRAERPSDLTGQGITNSFVFLIIPPVRSM